MLFLLISCKVLSKISSIENDFIYKEFFQIKLLLFEDEKHFQYFESQTIVKKLIKLENVL